MKSYWVYVLTNKINTVLYVGVTNDLKRRIYEHKNKLVEGFTKKYNLTKLVYFEEFPSPKDAIAVEKKIKGWSRWKKVQLIQYKNKIWKDISVE